MVATYVDKHFRHTLLSVAFLSGAALVFEGALLRLFAVAQYYHFAFLVVSLALLGFGAGGSLLSFWPSLDPPALLRFLRRLSLGFALSVGVAYGTVNWVPFDSYSIAWERRQILFFALYYLALTLPFLLAGLGIGAALSASRERSHLVYAANLAGSAAGALLSPLAVGIGGVFGAALLSGLVGVVGAGPLSNRLSRSLFAAGLLLFLGLGVQNLRGAAIMGMTLSPYKGLAQAKRYPEARILISRWNAVSRLDIVAGAGTRQLPGLSYVYDGPIPVQFGLAEDGDALQAIADVQPEHFTAAGFLPEAIAFDLRKGGTALVIEPGGGMGVLQALAGGMDRVIVVERNALITRLVSEVIAENSPFEDPRVQAVHMPVRAFLAQNTQEFELVYFPLTSRFQPVTSGAFSLSEDYSYTVESFQAAFEGLSPRGVIVASRWLQTPPTESLKLIATLAEALKRQGHPPRESLVAFRSFQTITVMARPAGWPSAELSRLREFLATRKFDLVWAPDIQPEEVNRYNKFPAAIYFETTRALLEVQDRVEYFERYPFDVRPPKDDRPFFFHFFKWEQTPDVLATLGIAWQPFGGSGYFVLLALLVLVSLISLVLIILPLRLAPRVRQEGSPPVSRTAGLRYFLYFSCLGIGFLFVEIPLIQRWILYLGDPPYAFVLVVVVLLLFSGAGSTVARRLGRLKRGLFFSLVFLVMVTAFFTPAWMAYSLRLPVWGRLAFSVLCLAPLGLLMGLPFPWGLAGLQRQAPHLVPWAWAVNGCVSVVASILAAMISLGNGFTPVLVIGGLSYLAALAVFPAGEW